MEVTKWLKPLVSVSRYTVAARVCRPVTRVNAEQNLQKDDAQADPITLSGKAHTAGFDSTVWPSRCRRRTGFCRAGP